ncbi:MAG: DUF6686 family protein [Cyclobacteriaceae bacterium]
MGNCQSILLAEIPDSNVTKCLQSGIIRWYFNNLMVAFQEKDFITFSKSFARIDFEQNGWNTGEGGRFVVINTPHQDIQFVFKEYEHQKLCLLFDKSRAELEILHIKNN